MCIIDQSSWKRDALSAKMSPIQTHTKGEQEGHSSLKGNQYQENWKSISIRPSSWCEREMVLSCCCCTIIILSLFRKCKKCWKQNARTNIINNNAQFDVFFFFLEKGQTIHFFFLFADVTFYNMLLQIFLVLGGSNQIRLPTIADSPDPGYLWDDWDAQMCQTI